MSTRLETTLTEHTVVRYYAPGVGACVQVTAQGTEKRSGEGYIRLTLRDAVELERVLREFVQKTCVERINERLNVAPIESVIHCATHIDNDLALVALVEQVTKP